MRVTQDEQMALNAARKETLALQKELQLLASLEKKLEMLENKTLGARPKAYTLDVALDPGDYSSKQEAFTISGGDFRCHAISYSLSVVGQAAIRDYAGSSIDNKAGQSLDISLPQEHRPVDFFWQIRESDGDNYLQEQPQPSVVLNSGHAAPRMLPVPLVLQNGATLQLELEPIFNYSDAGVYFLLRRLFENVSRYRVSFKFWGEEQVL